MSELDKALTLAEDWQFNQKHPRGQGGKFGPKPMQQQLQEEAQVQTEVPDPVAEEEEEVAPATTVDSGTNAQDAQVAISAEGAQRLKKAAGEFPALVVAFTNRADATKFAIACEHLIGADASLRVQAGANGRYFVEPDGLNPAEINAVQTLVYFGQPLSEINRETIDEVMSDREPDPEIKEEVMPVGGGQTMAKGTRGALMLLKVNQSDSTQDSTDNDGKAQALGTHERITDTVGDEEKITEKTAMYPKTGKKAQRRPRLIITR